MKIPNDICLRDQCPFRVIFPASADYLTRVVEPEKTQLLLTDPWYEKAVKWAQEVARAIHPVLPEAPPTAKDLENVCGPSAYRLFFNTLVNVDRRLRVLDLADWLAIKLVDRRQA